MVIDFEQLSAWPLTYKLIIPNIYKLVRRRKKRTNKNHIPVWSVISSAIYEGPFLPEILFGDKIIGNSFAHVYINIEREPAMEGKMEVVNYELKWVRDC